MKKLKILMIASECAPYVKTGGLGDVVGSLPQALAHLGHKVKVVIPLYSLIPYHQHGLGLLFQNLGVWMGGVQEWAAVHQTQLDDGLSVYLIEFHRYFAREGVYHNNNYEDYRDNARRFAFLTRAGLQLAQDLRFAPDIVHVHDWPTAVACAYLKTWHWNEPLLGGAASVLTIHNLAYQGVYPAEDWAYLGLGEANFTSQRFESFGRINLLQGGIATSDALNTVSPTYAHETRTPEGGYGLAPWINDRGDDYCGILNGVDYDLWNPEVDPSIPACYSKEDLSGKRVCKKALQQKFLLKQDPNIPLIGITSRLVMQKGLDLLTTCVEKIVQDMHVQLVVLGSGDKDLESYFGKLPARFPGQIGSFIGYDNALAHLVVAGSDFFLMPSRYEPCGLTQIYALRYGTLPIVRATGGLDDTVENYHEEQETGTGFKFWDFSSMALYYTVGWAVNTWYDRPRVMKKLIHQAMSQRFSWKESAHSYEQLYKKALQNKSRL